MNDYEGAPDPSLLSGRQQGEVQQAKRITDGIKCVLNELLGDGYDQIGLQYTHPDTPVGAGSELAIDGVWNVTRRVYEGWLQPPYVLRLNKAEDPNDKAVPEAKPAQRPSQITIASMGHVVVVHDGIRERCYQDSKTLAGVLEAIVLGVRMKSAEEPNRAAPEQI